MKFLRVFFFLVLSTPGVVSFYQSFISPIYENINANLYWKPYIATIKSYSTGGKKVLDIDYYFMVGMDTIKGHSFAFGGFPHEKELYSNALNKKLRNVKQIEIFANPSYPNENVMVREIISYKRILSGVIFSSLWIFIISFLVFRTKVEPIELKNKIVILSHKVLDHNP